MALGSFTDTSPSTTTPAYDFVAVRRNTGAFGGNGSFAPAPAQAEEPVALAPGYLPARAPGLSVRQRRMLAGGMGAAVLALGVYGVTLAVPAIQAAHARSVAAATSVSLPAAIAGMPLSSSHGSQSQVHSLAAGLPAPVAPKVAAYAAASRTIVVAAGAYAASKDDQSAYLSEVQKYVHPSGVVLASVEAGTLGGRMSCGSLPGGAKTFCAFVDSGGFGAIYVPGHGAQAVSTAAVVRSAVEHRS